MSKRQYIKNKRQNIKKSLQPKRMPIDGVHTIMSLENKGVFQMRKAVLKAPILAWLHKPKSNQFYLITCSVKFIPRL